MPTLESLNALAPKYITKEIMRCTFRAPFIVGMMLGLDDYYQRSEFNKTVGKFEIVGNEFKLNYHMADPQWEGVDPLSGDVNSRALAMQKAMRVIQGRFVSSTHQFGERVDKVERQMMESDESFAGWLEKVSQAVARGYGETVFNDLYPTDGSIRNLSATNLMSMLYPLQSGYANNAATGTGTYMYVGIDLNVGGLKALRRGTTSTSWVLSEQNLKKDFIMPLRDERGSALDLVLLDRDSFADLREELKATIRQSPDKPASYMPNHFQDSDGTFYVYDRGLRRMYEVTGIRRLLVLDSSVLRFGGGATSGGAKPMVESFDFIEQIPLQPTVSMMQGFARAGFINTNPRLCGQGFNVVLS